MIEKFTEHITCIWPFFRNPQISLDSWKKENLKTLFGCYSVSLMVSYMGTIVLFYAFASMNFPVYTTINPFYAILVIVLTTLYLAFVMGILLHIFTLFKVKDLTQKVILHFIKACLLLIPLFILLLILAVYITLAEEFSFDISPISKIFAFIISVFTLYVIYRVLLKPLINYLSNYMNKYKSVISVVAATYFMILIGQQTNIPFLEDSINEKQFKQMLIKGLHDSGKTDKKQLEYINEEIRKGNN